jgi:hypothetical protein
MQYLIVEVPRCACVYWCISSRVTQIRHTSNLVRITYILIRASGKKALMVCASVISSSVRRTLYVVLLAY